MVRYVFILIYFICLQKVDGFAITRDSLLVQNKDINIKIRYGLGQDTSLIIQIVNNHINDFIAIQNQQWSPTFHCDSASARQKIQLIVTNRNGYSPHLIRPLAVLSPNDTLFLKIPFANFIGYDNCNKYLNKNEITLIVDLGFMLIANEAMKSMSYNSKERKIENFSEAYFSEKCDFIFINW